MPARRSPRLFAYLLMLGVGAAIFFGVRAVGLHLEAPSPPADAVPFTGAGQGQGVEVLLHVLLALTAIIVAARALGALFRKIHQPPVMGEVIAGLLLGPSALGRLWPEAQAFLLPPAIAPSLGVIAQVGVLLYMFLVGLELNPAMLRGRAHAALAVSHASIVVPFVLGAGLALYTYPRYATSDVPFTVFALFSGVAMSVTAFPVLARILSDRGLTRTPIGSVALACAATDDVTAWCLLAFVVGVAQARLGGAVITLGLAAAYVAGMILVVRPLVTRLVERQQHSEEISRGVLAVLLIALLLSALITEAIGIHALFGAFLLGAIVPHDSKLAHVVAGKLEDVVVVLLLPAFFAYTGMRTQLGLVSGWGAWAMVLAIIGVASLGKFGGSFVAARFTGMSNKDSAILGALMNTRGLMELIVLNVGLDLRVLSPTLFAMLVLMAVVTTLATTPVVDALRPEREALPAHAQES